MLKITNRLIIDSAQKRGWCVDVLDEPQGIVRYTDSHGAKHITKSTMTCATSELHAILTDQKDTFSRLAREWNVPIPETEIYEDMESAQRFLQRHGRIVVKPHKGAHGHGVSTKVTDAAQLQTAIEVAQQISRRALLQQYIEGEDYRLLFIGGTLRAAAIRQPASVTGDGQHTIRELIETENRRPDRGHNYEKVLNIIDLDRAERYLGKAIDDVPPANQTIQVVGTANIGTGGYSVDATDSVPPDMQRYAQKVIDELHMPLCGVDFLYDEARGPVLIEVNISPNFSLHTFPYKGASRPVADHFLDWLETLPA